MRELKSGRVDSVAPPIIAKQRRSDWFNQAERVAACIDAAPYGQRNEVTARKAAALGLSRHTLRRHLSAQRWIATLAAADSLLAARLRTTPMASIEYLARLHRRNNATGLQVAHELARGVHSVKGMAVLANGCQAVERAALGRTSGRMLEIDFRRYLFQIIQNGLKEFQAGPDPTCVARLEGKLPFDIDIRVFGRSWRVLIAGPYRDEALLRNTRNDWCLKAIGVRHVAEGSASVLLCVPSRRHADDYRSTLTQWGSAANSVQVACVTAVDDVDTIWRTLREALA